MSRLGANIEDGLVDVASRCAAEFEWVALAVRIRARSGATSRRSLNATAETLRERFHRKSQVKRSRPKAAYRPTSLPACVSSSAAGWSQRNLEYAQLLWTTARTDDARGSSVLLSSDGSGCARDQGGTVMSRDQIILLVGVDGSCWAALLVAVALFGALAIDRRSLVRLTASPSGCHRAPRHPPPEWASSPRLRLPPPVPPPGCSTA